MGRTVTPRYRLEGSKIVTKGETFILGRIFQAWSGVGPGAAPTAENIARWRSRFMESTKPGGCNAHLGETSVGTCRIIEQKTGRVVAEYVPPMFEVIP